MTIRLTIMLATCCASAMVSAKSKLVHVTQDGLGEDGVPYCETLRDYSGLSPRAATIVKRFHATVGRDYHVRRSQRERSNDATLQRYEPRAFHGPPAEAARFWAAQKQQRDRLARSFAATEGAESNIFEARQRALIASLPVADRLQAVLALAPLAPPQGVRCRGWD